MSGRTSRKISKIAKKVSNTTGYGSIYTDLPSIPILTGARKVSIVLDSLEEIEKAVLTFARHAQSEAWFPDIHFTVISHDPSGDYPILGGKLAARRGFVLHHLSHSETEYLVVSPPVHSESVLGKIEHPKGATIFKVHRPSVTSMLVEKHGSKRVLETTRPMVVERTVSECANCFGLLGLCDPTVFKLLVEGKVVAKYQENEAQELVGFKILMSDPPSPEANPGSLKPVSLGVGILLTLTDRFPATWNLLTASMPKD